MSHILAPDNPSDEAKRLLGQARHCRGLATSAEETALIAQLMALAKSYEAKAALLQASCRLQG